MSPQVQHALGQLLIAVALAVLGVLAASQTDLIAAFGLNPAIWGGVIAAAIAGAVRAVEGFRDSQRAKDGLVQKSDVAFQFVQGVAADPYDASAAYVPGSNHDKIQVGS